MSVVGFDFGNENCVIAVAKQRGIDVLLNDESKRETPAVVSFSQKQRFMGLAGAACATVNPKSTISQVKRLIGRRFLEPHVQNDLKLLPFECVEGPDGGILIRLEYLGEIQAFAPVQILGMLFSHLKCITEKNLKMPISNCVIGIPSYFTDLQRRAYLDAAAIAGLRPLRLMHDCTATALAYGIYKIDFSTEGPTNVVFVDIGHCDTQVCVASFDSGQMKIISHAFDSNLGGRDFDEVLFSYFAALFKEKYNVDVCSNAKASIRLRVSCEKLKKVLSANAEAPLNIECLIDDKDVEGFIAREEFEKLSLNLLERIIVPCRKALIDSRLTVEKIHSVELVGSGSRIPAIGRILASLFKREPSRTINASECVARGCALQCAMLSPIFRVREYEVQDAFPFSIRFSSDKGPVCTLLNGALLQKQQPFPSVKILRLHRTRMFHMEACYADLSELPPGVSSDISNFMIGPFEASQMEATKVKVRVQLNIHGIVTIVSASLLENHADDPSTESDAHSTRAKMEVESNHGSSAIPNSAEDSSLKRLKPSSTSTADGMRKGKAVRRQEIPVSENIYGGMGNAELSDAIKKELQLVQQDLKMEHTKDKKNSLESYIYEMRDKMLNKYQGFSTGLELEGISNYLQRTEDWLYEEGVDESLEVYSEKLEYLQKLVYPIENRHKEAKARDEAAKNLLDCLTNYRMAVESLPARERDAVINECKKTEQWLQEKIHLQNALPKHADPVLWSSEIKKKTQALDTTCKHIIRSSASSPNPMDVDDSDQRDKPDGNRMQID